MKYSINKNIMDNIDTEAQAYWLGFFYADAYNNEKLGRIVIELQEQDKEHLNKCASFFGSPREPFLQLKNKGKYVAYRLELNSKHLSTSLKEKGCHTKKSFNIIFPTWINDKLKPHFIRGYFDGDGCINIHQNQLNISFVSTKEFNEELKIIFKKFDVNSQLYFPKRYNFNTCRLDFGGSRQVKRFCDWLYQDATIFLDRKYNLYKSYCENHVFK
jgi:intein/homing endonuclease